MEFGKRDSLIAALELILFYPDNISALIGFFMLHKKTYHNFGIGSNIVQSTIQYLREMKFQFIVLSYALGNEQSHQFWLKNDFTDTENEDIFDDITLKVMELNTTVN